MFHCFALQHQARFPILPPQDLLLQPVSLFQTKDFGDYLMVAGRQHENDHR